MRFDFDKPDEEEKWYGGVQKRWHFKNGYTASVVKHSFSYGNEKNLWELAVIAGKIVYDTPITNDVIGNLTEKKVLKLLSDISKLPQRKDE